MNEANLKWETLPTEQEEALAFMQWISLQPRLRDKIIHIPNEGQRTQFAGKYLKRIGLKKGVCDYFLPIPVAPYHGLWIELKRRSRYKMTPEQINFIKEMQAVDYAAHFAYGWEHAKSIILDYMKSVF